MAKRLRKVYIVCENNQIFGHMTNITVYKSRDSADWACKRARDQAAENHKKDWAKNQPLPVFKVHGFYLVHEDMFRD